MSSRLTSPWTLFKSKEQHRHDELCCNAYQRHNSIRSQQKLPPKSSLKRNFTISYDVNATNDFPNIPNTKKKLKQKPNTRKREAMGNTINTTTPATINNDDIISTLLDENNKTEQANITKLISDNNESTKLTFLQVLKNNN